MKRTGASTLVVLAVIGGVLAGLLQVALAASGRPVFATAVTLPFSLTAIGTIIVSLVIPIRRMTRGNTVGPVDPFYATRIVTLAKAASLSGALFVGTTVAPLVYLLTRSAAPALGSIGLAIAAVIGAGALLSCGLVAESMCRIPPDDKDKDNDDDRDTPLRVHS